MHGNNQSRRGHEMAPSESMELEDRNGGLPHTNSGASRLRHREDSTYARGHTDRHGQNQNENSSSSQHGRLKRDISELEGPSQCSLTDNTRSEADEASDALYADDDREPPTPEGADTPPSPADSKPSTALGVAITPFFVATIATTAFQAPSSSTPHSKSGTQHSSKAALRLTPTETPFSERTQSMSTKNAAREAAAPSDGAHVHLTPSKSLPPIERGAEHKNDDKHNERKENDLRKEQHAIESTSENREVQHKLLLHPQQQQGQLVIIDQQQQKHLLTIKMPSESLSESNLAAVAARLVAANASATATENTTPVDSGHYSSSYETSANARQPHQPPHVPTHPPLVQTCSETSPGCSRPISQSLVMRQKKRNYTPHITNTTTSDQRHTVVSVISVDESTVVSTLADRMEPSTPIGTIEEHEHDNGNQEDNPDAVGAVASPTGRPTSTISCVSMLGVGPAGPRTLSISRRGRGPGVGAGGTRVGRSTTTSTNAARHVHRRERKVTKTLTIVLFLFLFCWVPFFILNGTP